MVIINNSISNMIMINWQAEGLTAIECWVIACIIFVFGALLEYTVILLKLKLKKVIRCSMQCFVAIKPDIHVYIIM